MNLNAQDDRKKHIRAKKMMLLFSMLSIAMTFAGLTSAYIVSKSRPDWIIDFQLPSAFMLSTVFIVLSSLSILMAKKNVNKNNITETSFWLGITFLLSIFFCCFSIFRI